MSGANYKYLKPEDIKRLKNLKFSPDSLVEGHFAGRHISHTRGLSTEFLDYRSYVPGDDVKLIDWRVFARSDRYYLKIFEQETDTSCYIFLDSSNSMQFGTGMTKLDYGSYFTAALSYLVTSGNNMISLHLFDDKVKEFIPPGSSVSHLHNLLGKLDDNKAEKKETRITEVLKKSFHRLKKRGTVVIISDFYVKPEELFEALHPYISRNFKIHLLHIMNPDEINFSVKALTEFVDMETGSKVRCHPAEIKARYDKALDNHVSTLRELASRKNVRYAFTSTDKHYFELFKGLAK